MVFDKIKNVYSKRKESVQTKKELDNLLKEKARARAEEAYKQKVVEDRQKYMEDREEKLYEKELKKQGKTGYEDTRTTGEKFKEGITKVGSGLGTVGGKVTSDLKEVSSDISSPEVERFPERMEGSLVEEKTPFSNRKRYKEQPYKTPLPRMSKNRQSLPETEQNNMFFRSGGMYDDTDRLNNNMNAFSQKLYGKVPNNQKSILNGSGFMNNFKSGNSDFMEKFRLSGSGGLGLGGSSNNTFSKLGLGESENKFDKDKLRRFI